MEVGVDGVELDDVVHRHVTPPIVRQHLRAHAQLARVLLFAAFLLAPARLARPALGTCLLVARRGRAMVVALMHVNLVVVQVRVKMAVATSSAARARSKRVTERSLEVFLNKSEYT